MPKNNDPIKRDDKDVERAQRGWLNPGEDDEWLVELQELGRDVREGEEDAPS